MKISVLLVIVIFLFCIQLPLASASHILVNNADTVWDTTPEHSLDLMDATSGVTPRVIVENANSLSRHNLQNSESLAQLASGVTSRIIAEYANSISNFGLYRPDFIQAPPPEPDSPSDDTNPTDDGVAVYTVFATRLGLVGETTANGHVIEEHDHFVALPSTKVKCQNDAEHGHDYEVRITYNEKSVVAPVWDVGPWNTKDDYWNPSTEREMWQDLPQGMPEAQAAYNEGQPNGYNGGFDETNYIVEVSTNTDEFGIGDRVRVDNDVLMVRSTPGGKEIDSVSRNDIGTVIDGPQEASLEGLYYRWWKIQWDNGPYGWSAGKRYVGNKAGIDLADGVWEDLDIVKVRNNRTFLLL